MPKHTITHNGLTLSITEWAKRTNQSVPTLRYRLNAGWPTERALFEPIQLGRPRMGQRNSVRAIQFEREFSKLVLAVDNALRTFRDKLNSLLPDDDTPGVVENISIEPSDRCHPSTQDSV
jgi:hypothetical protein